MSFPPVWLLIASLLLHGEQPAKKEARPRDSDGWYVGERAAGAVIWLASFFLFSGIGSAQLSPTPTIQRTSKLVVVDVVARDRQHRPVTSLAAEDFTVREDGTMAAVKSFERHCSPAAEQGSGATGVEEPGVFTNAVQMTASEPLTVILLDSLNTQVADQSYVRSQLQAYLKGLPASHQIAVFALRDERLVMLQGFTEAGNLLKAAVASSEAMAASHLLTDPTGSGGDSPTSYQTAQGRGQQIELRDRYTLAALDELAKYLGRYPNRKNLIWFSGSFPLSNYTDVALDESVGVDRGAEGRLGATIALLTESRVAVYPVDSHSNSKAFGDPSNSDSRYVKRPYLMAEDLNAAGRNENVDHLSMEHVARDTGGEAFYNTSGIGEVVSHVIESGSCFYTLSYTSPSSSASKYRKIAIDVTSGRYSLTYRRGYFESASAMVGGDRAARKGTTSSPALTERMRRGSPDAEGIIFKARVLPVNLAVDKAVAANNKPDTHAKGPWRKYQIDIAADPRPMEWTRLDKLSFQSHLEVVVIVYDLEGKMFNSVSGPAAPILTQEKLLEAGRTGLGVSALVSVPLRGSYMIRVGLQDTVNGQVGTLEVPVNAIKDLPPIPAGQAKP